MLGLDQGFIYMSVSDHCSDTGQTGAESITELGNPGSHEDSFVSRFMQPRRTESRTQAFQLRAGSSPRAVSY